MSTVVQEPVTKERKEYDKLTELRDEIKLQLHLGKAELRKQWEELEPKWRELQGKIDGLERASLETARELKKAVWKLFEELGEGYERIRKAL